MRMDATSFLYWLLVHSGLFFIGQWWGGGSSGALHAARAQSRLRKSVRRAAYTASAIIARYPRVRVRPPRSLQRKLSSAFLAVSFNPIKTNPHSQTRHALEDVIVLESVWRSQERVGRCDDAVLDDEDPRLAHNASRRNRGSGTGGRWGQFAGADALNQRLGRRLVRQQRHERHTGAHRSGRRRPCRPRMWTP
jgi:hypothetical protein